MLFLLLVSCCHLTHLSIALMGTPSQAPPGQGPRCYSMTTWTQFANRHDVTPLIGTSEDFNEDFNGIQQVLSVARKLLFQ